MQRPAAMHHDLSGFLGSFCALPLQQRLPREFLLDAVCDLLVWSRGMVGEGRRDGVSVCFGVLGVFFFVVVFLFGCLTVWLTDESFRWDAYSPTCTYVSIEINRVGLPFCLKVASRTKGFS